MLFLLFYFIFWLMIIISALICELGKGKVLISLNWERRECSSDNGLKGGHSNISFSAYTWGIEAPNKPRVLHWSSKKQLECAKKLPLWCWKIYVILSFENVCNLEACIGMPLTARHLQCSYYNSRFVGVPRSQPPSNAVKSTIGRAEEHGLYSLLKCLESRECLTM